MMEQTRRLHTATPIKANPYVPVNMPAISDLFEMFQFDRDDHDR